MLKRQLSYGLSPGISVLGKMNRVVYIAISLIQPKFTPAANICAATCQQQIERFQSILEGGQWYIHWPQTAYEVISDKRIMHRETSLYNLTLSVEWWAGELVS